MFFRLVLTLYFLIFSTNLLLAQQMNPEFSWDKISSIYVQIDDNAEGNCWTNLKESREYAEEKLRAKGISVKQNMPVEYLLNIKVNAMRDKLGWCIGVLHLRLTTLGTGDDIFGHLIMGEDGYMGQIERNFNSTMIDLIFRFI